MGCCVADAPEAQWGLRYELGLLRSRWPIILGCLAFQYVHGISTQLAYRMHQPAAAPLHDVGFALLPELAPEWRWVSEALFTALLLCFVAWTFTPLLPTMRRRQCAKQHQQQQRQQRQQRQQHPPAFSCVVLWSRLLSVLVVCQVLRILSFSATQLPGPAPHCRLGTRTAHRAPARAWQEHLLVDVATQVAHSCGDLLFSSHMTFVLLGALSYTQHGRVRLVKAAAWLAAASLALLIISARKHYTVDVVVAWYVVPLVYCCLHGCWARRDQRQAQQAARGQQWLPANGSQLPAACSRLGSSGSSCACCCMRSASKALAKKRSLDGRKADSCDGDDTGDQQQLLLARGPADAGSGAGAHADAVTITVSPSSPVPAGMRQLLPARPLALPALLPHSGSGSSMAAHHRAASGGSADSNGSSSGSGVLQAWWHGGSASTSTSSSPRSAGAAGVAEQQLAAL